MALSGLALVLLKGGVADGDWHRPAFGPLRRTVLVAGPESSRTDVRRESYNMKGNRAVTPDPEPIGIVISRGAQVEQPPTFFAYVWGPAPEPSDEPESKVA